MPAVHLAAIHAAMFAVAMLRRQTVTIAIIKKR